jgi:hypothetical protein
MMTFFCPEKTLLSMKKIRNFYDQVDAKLGEGISLEEAFRREDEAV